MEKMMLQEVMTAPKQITFREIPVPEPGDDQVLVKIMKIGVCGSDIHVYHGTHPFTSYPVTQGHEVSAKVVSWGANVSGFSEGQRVTIEPQVYCGKCYPCTHGKYNLCEELKVMGFQTTGTASEYFAVKASKVTPLPETMTYYFGAGRHRGLPLRVRCQIICCVRDSRKDLPRCWLDLCIPRYPLQTWEWDCLRRRARCLPHIQACRLAGCPNDNNRCSDSYTCRP